VETKTYEETVKLLAELCEQLDQYEYGRKVLDKNYKAIKEQVAEIGRVINKDAEDRQNDGLLAMRMLCVDAMSLYRNSGNALNHAWDGIGLWES